MEDTHMRSPDLGSAVDEHHNGPWKVYC